MATNLRTGLRQSIKSSLETGLVGSNIFGTSTLDLRFAQQKSLGPRVTFTRASSATFVGSDGLIKTAVTNLLLQSNQFDTTWANTNSSETAAAGIAPDGTNTAWELKDTADAVATPHTIAQILSWTAGVTYTVSCWMKAGTLNEGGISFPGAAFTTAIVCRFNLTTGALISASAGITASSVVFPNGWIRIIATATATTTAAAGGINIRTANGGNSYIGTGTGTILVWGAQVEQSSTVGEYIPTTSTINSAPRFDHNPTTGESLGLLVEEPRTNSIRNNTMVGAVAGSPGTPPTNGWVITNNATYASSVIGTGIENGINYIDIQYVIAAGAAASGGIVYADTPAATASTAYTGSYYLKLVSGASPQVRFVWQDGASTFNRTFFDLTSTLTRYTDTLTTSVGANLARFAISFAASPSGATFVIRVGLPQVEQGAFATSVIPTTSGTVTRAADVASITGSNFSSWYNQTEGTMFVEGGVPVGSTGVRALASFDDGTTAERIRLGHNGTTAIATVVTDGGIFQFGPAVVANSFPPGEYRKLAVAVKAADFATITTPGTVVAGSSGTMPTPTQLQIGFAPGNTQPNLPIKRLTYWPVRLQNNTLQAITQP